MSVGPGSRRQRSAGFVLLPVMLLLALVAAMAFLGHRETSLGSAVAGGVTDQDKARYAAEAGLNRTIVKMHATGCGGTYPFFLFSPVQDTAFDGGKYYAYASPLSGSPVTVTSTGTYGDASITLTRQDSPMHQATPFTITLQPAAEGIDTYVQSGSSSNNGNLATLLAASGTAFPMLQFDLSTIPAGAHVSSATLSAYATSGSGSDQVALYRSTRSWTEAATWVTSDGSTAWSQAGGDATALAVASTAFTAAGSWLNWDATALVDKWVKGNLPNQGVQVRAGAAVSNLQLASSDATTAAQRPKLSVTFLPPCGWSPPTTTVTLAPTADTDIDKDLPNNNFGLQPDLYLSNGFEAHPLLQFSLLGIPAGSVVKSAKLRLYFSAVNVAGLTATKTSKNLELEAHAATKSWAEVEATWKKRLLASNWTAQGGDYRASPSGTNSLNKDSTPGVWLEFTVTSLVQEWVDGVTVNNGFLLLTPTTSTTEELIFNSKEAASSRPELVVTYQ